MIDQAIVLIYFAIVLIVGLMVGRNTSSLKDFAIGNRDFSTLALVAAVFASIVDASGTIGLVGKTLSIGPAFVLSYLGTLVGRTSIAFIIAPRMRPFMGLISAGDIFEQLFGRRAKTLMGVSTVIESTLMAGMQVLAITYVVQYFFKIPASTAAICTSLVIILYSYRGGIRSVTATDIFQFMIMVVAIPIMCTIGITKIGGYGELFSVVKTNGIYFSEPLPGDSLKHIATFLAFSLPVLYPMCIQRMLMAKNTQQIKKTFLITGMLSLPFVLTVGCIGVVAFVLLPTIDPNHAFAGLIDLILPVGIQGLVITGLLAIFMSTIDSILNVGAVAITHDLVGSIVTTPLSKTTALKVARVSSVAMALGSIWIALSFSSVFEVMFLIMVLGNSVFFPGFLVGILGLKPQTRYFWSGVGVGATVVLVCHFWFGFFEIYTMLIAIACNMSVLLCPRLSQLVTQRFILLKYVGEFLLKQTAKLRPIHDDFFEFRKTNFSVASSSYCDIFATLVLIKSILPFFFQASYHDSFPTLFLISNVLAAVFALLVVFRQIVDRAINGVFPWIWHLTIAMGLSFQSVALLVQPKFDLMTFANLGAIISLFLLLLSKGEIVAQLVLTGVLLAAVLITTEPTSLTIHMPAFGQWSFCIHSLAVVLCLFLFRKRDIAAYQFMVAKLAHEAARSHAAFSSSGHFLNRHLPSMVERHRTFSDKNVDEKILSRIEKIPKELIETSERNWNHMRALLVWMKIYDDDEKPKQHSIKTIVSLAVNDISIPEHVRSKVNIKDTTDFWVLGDCAQITQVIINLLENAGHAIANHDQAAIWIWTSGNSLYIEDNGVGISKSNLPNIFDEFFSTRGTAGQGLSFCKLVIENHNGEITCESKEGAFTRFIIKFPHCKKGATDRTAENEISGTSFLPAN